LSICVFRRQKNHEGLPENTTDTIQKKMFIKFLLHICVFVFKPKKSQPKGIISLFEHYDDYKVCKLLSFKLRQHKSNVSIVTFFVDCRTACGFTTEMSMAMLAHVQMVMLNT
jgi:hypothetical protein